MKASRRRENYARRINKVCDYIYAHLDTDLSVEQLSRIANFSPYHFHRQFSEYTGISLFRFIQLLRLKRASYQLVFNRDYRIIDIALQARFENPASFSRAFKKFFEQTPSQFRKNPRWAAWLQRYQFYQPEIGDIMNIEIVNFAETRVAVMQHRASPDLLNDSVSRFIQWRNQSRLSPVNSSRTFGLAYDDPKTTPAKEFRFDICGEVEDEIPDNALGVVNQVIPGGRCARLRHEGSHELLGRKVHYLYGEWLPASGEELRNFPCYFHYVNIFPEVSEHELITDVYLPLR